MPSAATALRTLTVPCLAGARSLHWGFNMESCSFKKRVPGLGGVWGASKLVALSYETFEAVRTNGE